MEQQVEKMVTDMQAFSKDTYFSGELYGQYIALQKEFAHIATGEENCSMKVQELCEYFSEKNKKYRGVATKALERFKSDCGFMVREICGLRTGRDGERQAFKSLETLKCKNRVLRNIELEFDGHKTELDAIVFTKQGVFIVEVKNMNRDILIDENGNLQERVSPKGDYKTLYNLGSKMNEKEHVVRQALQMSDYKTAPIKSFVVFTNSEIKLQNRYRYVTSCFLSNLPRLIDQECHNGRYSVDEFKNMYYSVLNARTRHAYPITSEVQKIKRSFAEVYLLLKAAEERTLMKKNRFKNFFLGLRKIAIPVAAASVSAFSFLFLGKN